MVPQLLIPFNGDRDHDAPIKASDGDLDGGRPDAGRHNGLRSGSYGVGQEGHDGVFFVTRRFQSEPRAKRSLLLYYRAMKITRSRGTTATSSPLPVVSSDERIRLTAAYKSGLISGWAIDQEHGYRLSASGATGTSTWR